MSSPFFLSQYVHEPSHHSIERWHGRIYFAQAFAGAMKKAYPDLPGADGLEDLAKALYK